MILNLQCEIKTRECVFYIYTKPHDPTVLLWIDASTIAFLFPFIIALKKKKVDETPKKHSLNKISLQLSFSTSPLILCCSSEQSGNDQSWRFPQSQWSTSQAGPPTPIIKAIASALTFCGAACYFSSTSSVRVHPVFQQRNYFCLHMLKIYK